MGTSLRLSGSKTAPLRVLLAESDPEVKASYRDALRQLGCDVVEAADGREALVEALVRTPSFVVVAANLEYINGRELCRILRTDSTTRTVPIVGISDTREEDLDLMRRAGADSVLVKPVDANTLLSELSRLSTALHGDSQSARSVANRLAPRNRRQTVMREAPQRPPGSPPLAPPALRCPQCDRILKHRRSHVGGVTTRPVEQWETYECSSCGAFEYRHRTRKLRGPHRSR